MAASTALKPLNNPLTKFATRKRAHKSRNPQGIAVKKTKLDHDDVVDVVESDRYERLDAIGDGSYGTVYRATDTRTGEIVAMKKERYGLNKTTLREIDILRSLSGHSSVVEIKEVILNKKGQVYVVMEYVKNNLDHYIQAPNISFDISFVKAIMQQLLEGVAIIHDKGFIHRDLKSDNILMSERGHVKICDFGLSRRVDKEYASYSPKVASLWYRPPEILMGTRNYSSAIDMWAVGCIMAEVLTKRVLFEGSSEIDQLHKIIKILGKSGLELWGMDVKLSGPRDNVLWEKLGGAAVVSKAGLDLMKKLLAYKPGKRITAAEALDHDWFKED